MNEDRNGLLIFVGWIIIIILSIATGHFNAPEELRTSWHHFVAATFAEKLKGVIYIAILAIPVTITSFIVGIVLLPLEIVIFPLLAALDLNGFYLVMFIIWKYILLFTVIF